MNSFSDIIGRWGTVSAFATDLGVPKTTAYSWRQRGTIPAEHFTDVLRAASAKGFHEITPALLVRIAGQRSGTVSAVEAA